MHAYFAILIFGHVVEIQLREVIATRSERIHEHLLVFRRQLVEQRGAHTPASRGIGMAGKKDILADFMQGIGVDSAERELAGINHSLLQAGIDLRHGHVDGAAAKPLEERHVGRERNTDHLTLQVSHRADRLVGQDLSGSATPVHGQDLDAGLFFQFCCHRLP